MAKILVGTYGKRRDADDARARLLEQGFNDSQISVEGGEDAASELADPVPNPSARDGRGIRGVVARMFSDLFPDRAEHERYERAVRTGGSLVAVHGLHDDDAARARPILERNGVVDEHTLAEAEAWDPTQPDETPLPNAPTAWNEATQDEHNTIGRAPNDPARPEGATRGANDIGATLDRERLERRS